MMKHGNFIDVYNNHGKRFTTECNKPYPRGTREMWVMNLAIFRRYLALYAIIVIQSLRKNQLLRALKPETKCLVISR